MATSETFNIRNDKYHYKEGVLYTLVGTATGKGKGSFEPSPMPKSFQDILEKRHPRILKYKNPLRAPATTQCMQAMAELVKREFSVTELNEIAQVSSGTLYTIRDGKCSPEMAIKVATRFQKVIDSNIRSAKGIRRDRQVELIKRIKKLKSKGFKSIDISKCLGLSTVHTLSNILTWGTNLAAESLDKYEVAILKLEV